MDTPQVTIYSTPTCHFCHMAKDFLKSHDIDFTEHDVMKDEDADQRRTEMIDLTGQMGVPVIKVGDDVMVGFNEAKIRELLGLGDEAPADKVDAMIGDLEEQVAANEEDTDEELPMAA